MGTEIQDHHNSNEIALDDLASKIRAEHEAVHEAAMTTTRHAIECGNLLIAAKSGLPHGKWLPWLKEHCELSERTAQAYTRLARRFTELDDEKAQRVADLPVRQAMVAIADQRAEQIPDILNRDDPPSEDEIWAWAGRQVNGPFNRFDFDTIPNGGGGGLGHGAKCVLNKLLSQTGVPALAAFCLANNSKDIPMLRLVPDDELTGALKNLAPVAKGSIAGLDIDWEDIGTIRPPENLHRFSGRQKKTLPYNAAFAVSVLTIDAQWLCGGLLNEMEYRCSTYKDLSDDEYADRYRSECDGILEAFQADGQRQLDEVKCAIAEGRDPDI